MSMHEIKMNHEVFSKLLEESKDEGMEICFQRILMAIRSNGHDNLASWLETKKDELLE